MFRKLHIIYHNPFPLFLPPPPSLTSLSLIFLHPPYTLSPSSLPHPCTPTYLLPT